ncbi:MAG: GTPase (G3E family), partial [Firmicutes bacterium]|nr:GTPase (G3E family) [Bacillota bacterium]
SDIPGLGIGALDNFYLQLNEKEPGEFDLMPFLCIIDPERIRMVMPEEADLNLPDELKFLLNAQMAEADLIVLNKTDTISAEKKEEIIRFVKDRYPDTPVLAMSALTGEGVDEVVDHLLSNKAAAVHRDIGYGSEEFIAAESLLCWYNRRSFFEQREGKNLDYNQVITDLFEAIRDGLKKAGANVPHLKMFASDGAEQNADVFKASLIGVDYDIEYTSKLKSEYTALSLIINARAAADADVMADIVADAVDSISVKYDLKVRTYFVESFGMMDEGRGNTGRASKY